MPLIASSLTYPVRERARLPTILKSNGDLQPEDLADLQTRQLAILQSAMQHAAPGARLVYSTCSLEREECQVVVEKALAAEPSFRLLDGRLQLEQLRAQGELVWNETEFFGERAVCANHSRRAPL